MADLKITQLPNQATLQTGALFVVVNDPLGTPVTAKATIDAIATYMQANLSFSSTLDTAYNGGSAITADAGAVAITVPDTANTPGLTIVSNDATNEPVAAHFISNQGGQDVLLVENSNNGWPGIQMYWSYSGSQNGADVGRISAYGQDTLDAKVLYGQMDVHVNSDVAAAYSAGFDFKTPIAGTLATRLFVGHSGLADINGIGVGNGSSEAIIAARNNTNLALRSDVVTLESTDTYSNVSFVNAGTSNMWYEIGSTWYAEYFSGPTGGSYGEISLGNTYAYFQMVAQNDEVGFYLKSNRTAPAIGDLLVDIEFIGETSTGASVTYSGIQGRVLDPTNGTTDGETVFQSRINNVLTDVFKVGPTATLYGNEVVAFEPTSVASAASITPTGDTKQNEHYVTALATNLTINAPTGTLVNGNSLLIRIKDDGSFKTLTWNAIFRAIGVTLPSVTVAGKTMYIGCKYNSTDAKWDVIAVSQEA